jgi:hypothetical protein
MGSEAERQVFSERLQKQPRYRPRQLLQKLAGLIHA